MRKNKLKIIIPILFVILALIIYILSLNFATVRSIEIEANGLIKIDLNHYNKVIKTQGLDQGGQDVLNNIKSESKTSRELIKNILVSSNELKVLDDKSTINILYVSKDLNDDTTLIKDLSTELELLTTEIPLACKINQYKLTNKDYKVVNEVKASTHYSIFKIIDEGFISKEKIPYITSIIYKSDSFFINFSKDMTFDGKETVKCYAGDKAFQTAPAGYSNNAMAIFVDGVDPNVSLNFDVTNSAYPDLIMFGTSIINSSDEKNSKEVTFSIDADVNRKKVDDLKKEIINADIADSDRDNLLKQLDTLNSSIDKIASSEDLNDFNKMYEDLVKSLETAKQKQLKEEVKTEPEVKEQTPVATTQTSPVDEPEVKKEPTTKPTSDFNKLNSDYYNELNGYKAIVLRIQDTDQRNTLNAEINQLYYKLSIAKTQADYDAFAQNLSVFLGHLSPYM